MRRRGEWREEGRREGGRRAEEGRENRRQNRRENRSVAREREARGERHLGDVGHGVGFHRMIKGIGVDIWPLRRREEQDLLPSLQLREEVAERVPVHGSAAAAVTRPEGARVEAARSAELERPLKPPPPHRGDLGGERLVHLRVVQTLSLGERARHVDAPTALLSCGLAIIAVAAAWRRKSTGPQERGLNVESPRWLAESLVGEPHSRKLRK